MPQHDSPSFPQRDRELPLAEASQTVGTPAKVADDNEGTEPLCEIASRERKG